MTHLRINLKTISVNLGAWAQIHRYCLKVPITCDMTAQIIKIILEVQKPESDCAMQHA